MGMDRYHNTELHRLVTSRIRPNIQLHANHELRSEPKPVMGLLDRRIQHWFIFGITDRDGGIHQLQNRDCQLDWMD